MSVLSRLVIVLGMVGLFGSSVIAQHPGATATEAPPAPPQLTELEQTKLELLQLRIAYARLLAQDDSCKADLGSAYQTLGTLRAKVGGDELSQQALQLELTIEQAHPGFSFDTRTGAFTKKPEQPSGKKK